ncbi:LppA family lipoprotein [Mycolicibacterium sp. XJ775]|jgi:hypothetical protein
MVDRRLIKQARRRVTALTFLVCTSMVIGGCSLTENPYESKTVEGEEAIKLIDTMRAKGSYEDARARLNTTAQTIAERVAAAIPGQTWKFSDDPDAMEVKASGLPCTKLTMDVARRPLSDMVIFGRTFTSEEFEMANDIVRQEAARVGAAGESSLFNDDAKRDYDVQGNGYEFNLRQGGTAMLTATGDCFLMQSVVDLPPGQLPPK